MDLEGPLSPQDNAYEVLGLTPDGHRLFEVISRYDDLLALEAREGYEPGDTLKLILPFLVAAGIRTRHIEEVSHRAGLVPGATDLVARVRSLGWKIYVVSTSYEPHAWNIVRRLGLRRSSLVCTPVSDEVLGAQLSAEDLEAVATTRERILGELYVENLQGGQRDRDIKDALDEFYRRLLPETRLGRVVEQVEVRGGRRKAWAIEECARRNRVSLRSVAFVGDSITDVRACQLVETMGGMAIAFNANEFLLPHATLGVASLDLADILPVLERWHTGGRRQVRGWIESQQSRDGEQCIYDWLAGTPVDMARIVSKHRQSRALVRQEAAKLG